MQANYIFRLDGGGLSVNTNPDDAVCQRFWLGNILNAILCVRRALIEANYESPEECGGTTSPACLCVCVCVCLLLMLTSKIPVLSFWLAKCPCHIVKAFARKWYRLLLESCCNLQLAAHSCCCRPCCPCYLFCCSLAAVVSWCCICRFVAPAIGNWRTPNGQWPMDKGQRSRALSLSGQWAEETHGPCYCLCAS